MRKFIIPVLAGLAISLGSCNSGSGTQNSSTAGQADSSFDKISRKILDDYLQHNPESAVALGFHDFDGKVSDYSNAGLDSQLAQIKIFQHELSALDTSQLSPGKFYDYRILRNALRSTIFQVEELKPQVNNPMSYAGAIDVSIYVKRDFAPIDERLKSIIAIENKAPLVFSQAKVNLADSLAKPFIETAIAVAQGGIEFLSGDLVKALSNVKNDSLMKSFHASNALAITEIKNYIAWLQKEKLPKSHTHYAIGREKYQKMLNGEFIYVTPEKILETGLQELKKEQDVFNAAAKIINPNKKPVDVYHDLQKDHPVADSLIPEARKNLEAIRQFLLDRNIVTMPSNVRAKIEETPQYARSTSTASMDTPGPFEQKATEAYYYITPVDPKWTPRQKEDWLGQFDYYTMDNVTIHEVYPGHYTQFLHLNASSATEVEKIFGSYAFVEGWAHYTEKMMADEGYGNTGDSVKIAKHRLAQSGDALLRLCRLCVSVKTHCEGISVDEGTRFLMDNWYQGDKPSRQEAIRGTFDPGYCFYTLGKLQILKLREDYKKQEGSNYSLKKFHDAMLDHGMPPIRLMREILLKDKTQWDAIL